MKIPHQQLKPETLKSLAAEFVMQEGTDYGHQEYNFETKVQQVLKAVCSGRAEVVFDPKTESCTIKTVEA